MECDGPSSAHRLSHLLLVSTCLVCVFSITSAYSLPSRRDTGSGPELAKREVQVQPWRNSRSTGTGGLELHCMVHPRNCPAKVLFHNPARARNVQAQSRARKRMQEVEEDVPLDQVKEQINEQVQQQFGDIVRALLSGRRWRGDEGTEYRFN